MTKSGKNDKKWQKVAKVTWNVDVEEVHLSVLCQQFAVR
jgi:hypothetical protein